MEHENGPWHHETMNHYLFHWNERVPIISLPYYAFARHNHYHFDQYS